jgi:diguanylate cyclase (GGDEF)-like protein
VRLPTKILLLITPMVVVPILTIGIAAYRLIETSDVARAAGETASLAEQLQMRLQGVVVAAHANLELFAQSNLLYRYVFAEDEDVRYVLLQPSLLRQFTSYQQAYPEYFEIRLKNVDGEEEARASVRPHGATIGPAQDGPFLDRLRANSDPVHHEFTRDPQTRELILMVGKRLAFREPYLDPITAPLLDRGYLIMHVTLGPMITQASRALRESTGYFITDGDGSVVFGGSLLEDRSALPPEQFRPLLKSVAEGHAVSLQLAGQDAVAHGLELDDDFLLFAAYSMAATHRASRLLGIQVILVTLAAVLVATGLLFAVLHYLLVSPLNRLSLAARAIGSGDLDHRIDIASRDEVGLLADTFRDMCGNLKESSRQISFLAYHDSLTGLHNRSMFREFLTHAMAHARRNGERLALLFIDIDDFKKINDSVGHPFGDELLTRFADRLSECLRDEDFISRSNRARLGGDEFLVMLSGVKTPLDAGKVAERIVRPFDGPVRLADQEFLISASIGISVFPEDGTDGDTLIRNADTAMYHAKRLGKSDYQFFSQELNAAILERVQMEARLRPALERNEFVLHYQPQVDLRSGELVGLEALIRWDQPDVGLVPPNQFIPLAEETGLIVPLGLWVVETVCAQIADWRARGLMPVPIAFNVSAAQIKRPGLVEGIAAAMNAHRVEPGMLELELTETAVMHAPDQAIATIAAVADLGLRISLDDFGTGYSSLSHLRRFAINQLKIDRSFVKDIGSDPDDAAIVGGVIALAQSLGLGVIAEGVEDEEQRAFLLARGCELGQGYYFGRPEPAAAIETRFQRQQRASGDRFS